MAHHKTGIDHELKGTLVIAGPGRIRSHNGHSLCIGLMRTAMTHPWFWTVVADMHDLAEDLPKHSISRTRMSQQPTL